MICTTITVLESNSEFLQFRPLRVVRTLSFNWKTNVNLAQYFLKKLFWETASHSKNTGISRTAPAQWCVWVAADLGHSTAFRSPRKAGMLPSRFWAQSPGNKKPRLPTKVCRVPTLPGPSGPSEKTRQGQGHLERSDRFRQLAQLNPATFPKPRAACAAAAAQAALYLRGAQGSSAG